MLLDWTDRCVLIIGGVFILTFGGVDTFSV
jgi:hypothetical protein